MSYLAEYVIVVIVKGRFSRKLSNTQTQPPDCITRTTKLVIKWCKQTTTSHVLVIEICYLLTKHKLVLHIF